MQGRAGRCIGPAIDDEYTGEPVPQRTADAVVECMDLGRQRQPTSRARRRRGGGLEEARLGRRTLAEAAVDGVRLQRMQALAQYCFDCRFPARVDAQRLPELRRAGEPVALEPFAQRRIVLRVCLDLPQGRQLCLRCRVLALRHADSVCGLRARFLQRCALRLQRLKGLARRVQRGIDL